MQRMEAYNATGDHHEAGFVALAHVFEQVAEAFDIGVVEEGQ